MSKPLCLIQAPYATRSGYGDMARDIIRHVIELDQYDVHLISMPWGNCPMNALSAANTKDTPLISRMMKPPYQLPRKPELFIQISVPNEFQPIGQYNIGITAGIETTLCSAEWMEGLNRMNVNFTISEHSKRVFESTIIEHRNPQTGQTERTVKLEKPVEVLHNCIDTNIFKRIDAKEIPETIKSQLDTIPEEFNFLFVGHWLQGDIGADRKNVGLLVKTFCETFKTKPTSKRPALILKTSGATFSVIDQLQIRSKITMIRDMIGAGCPNVYLLHGELTEEEMNGLYNHPKIKAHVTFTKGEGFGRPLLEATQSNKPILASGWSGHIDFLNADDAVLLAGSLGKVEASAVWQGVIVPEAQWFNVDVENASRAFQYVFKNHGKLTDGAYRLAKKNRDAFAYDVIKAKTKELLDKYVPQFAVPVPIKLPALKKVGATTP
jgi:glycosyltransferase involved in cell wall biosynthesis